MKLVQFHTCGYGHFDARRPIWPSCWGHFDLLWIHSGRVTIQLGDSSQEQFDGGEGVLIYPDTPFVGHAVTATARGSIQHFGLVRAARTMPGVLRGLTRKRRGYMRYAIRDSEPFEAMIDHAMYLATLPASAWLHDLRVAQLVLVLGQLELARMQQPEPGPRQDGLDALLEKLQSRVDRPMCLQEMANHMGLSTSHFRAMFRDRVGQTPGQYQQHLRMSEAARRLRDTDLPIKQVAQQLGFTDLAHFYRRFKALHRQSPHRYRLSHTPRA